MSVVKSKLSWLAMVAFVVAAHVHCGSSSATGAVTGGGDLALSSIEDLPLASAPVVSSSSSSVSFHGLTADAAVSGVTLKDMTSANFTADSSLGMCNMSMNMKESLNQAAQGDLILCYVQNTLANVESVDIYDGEEHIFDLTDETEEAGAFRVKMQIVKEGGAISSFKMWACDGADLESMTQSQYLSQTIDGTDFTLVSKEISSQGESSWSNSLVVEAALNTDGEFTSKTITSDYVSDWGGSQGYGHKVVEQGADSATVSVWQSGIWNNDEHENTYSDRVYGLMELLNTTALSTISVGDGAAMGVSSGTFFDGFETQAYDWDYSEGWNGDTTAVDPESSFIASLEASLIPELGTEPTVEFTGDEIYDCSGTATAVTIDQASLDVACSEINFGYDWVNCYDVIQNAE